MKGCGGFVLLVVATAQISCINDHKSIPFYHHLQCFSPTTVVCDVWSLDYLCENLLFGGLFNRLHAGLSIPVARHLFCGRPNGWLVLFDMLLDLGKECASTPAYSFYSFCTCRFGWHLRQSDRADELTSFSILRSLMQSQVSHCSFWRACSLLA